jgi:hypothetical protein
MSEEEEEDEDPLLIAAHAQEHGPNIYKLHQILNVVFTGV